MRNSKVNSDRGSLFLRLFDKYLGVPLIFLLGLFHRKAERQATVPERIALLKSAAIGDTVVLLPAIASIRKKYPNVHITVFTGKSNYAIAGMVKGVDQVICLPINNPIKSILGIRAAGEFDWFFDFGSWPRIDAILTAFARAKFKLGFRTAHQYRHFAFDLTVEHRDDQHEYRNYLDLIHAVGIPEGTSAKVTLDYHCDLPYELDSGRRYVVLHLFPGGFRSSLKEWGFENWLAIARYFLTENWIVVLTGANADYDKAESLVALLNHTEVINLAGKLNLAATAKLLDEVDLVISVNTGVMHLAAVFNTPLLAIHGPTNPIRWGPLSTKAKVIEPSGVSCSPCLNLGFEYSGCNNNCCMKSITVDQVIESVKKLDL